MSGTQINGTKETIISIRNLIADTIVKAKKDESIDINIEALNSVAKVAKPIAELLESAANFALETEENKEYYELAIEHGRFIVLLEIIDSVSANI